MPSHGHRIKGPVGRSPEKPTATCRCRYCLAMTSADPGAGFSLNYELQPDDLQDSIAARPQRKRQRTRLIFATVGWALIDAAFTAVTVALDLPSVVKNAEGAPSWMYVVDAAIWFCLLYTSDAADDLLCVDL